jgi:hypothetical protein
LAGADRHDDAEEEEDDDDDDDDDEEEAAVVLDCDGAIRGGRDVTSPVALVTVRFVNTTAGGPGTTAFAAGIERGWGWTEVDDGCDEVDADTCNCCVTDEDLRFEVEDGAMVDGRLMEEGSD